MDTEVREPGVGGGDEAGEVLATLIEGDCRLLIPGIPKKSVDLVLTDPPYGNMIEFAGHGVIPGDHNYADLLKETAPLLYAAAAKDAWACVFTEPKALREMWAAMEAGGWKYRSLMVWDKRRLSFNQGIRRAYELILVMKKGSPENRYSGGDLVTCTIARDRIHPTQKPVELLKDLIEWFCPERGLVLDPFSGGGSTLVAANEVGRRSIGFEVDRGFFEASADRLFPDVNAVPKEE